jgi:hypothetical protein
VAVGGSVVGEDEDRRRRDTRLSRALCDRDAGPRLRSSYSRSVVITAGLCPHAAHACRVMPPGTRLREEEGD